jgi:hypothetical protein
MIKLRPATDLVQQFPSVLGIVRRLEALRIAARPGRCERRQWVSVTFKTLFDEFLKVDRQVQRFTRTRVG